MNETALRAGASGGEAAPAPSPPALRPLSGRAGQTAIAALMRRRPLLAFDFDGTLTPIVPRPDDARLDAGVAARLARLAALRPVAIVTGRALADLRTRLGFTPTFAIGSHGAEDEADRGAARRHAEALEPLRATLRSRAAALAAAGVAVEDKGPSVALHYRLAPDRAAARALIDAVLAPHVVPGGAPLRVFAGKMVINAMAAGAPDKADAVRALVARSGAGTAFFAGDDVNDEPVFAAAPRHWLTVRVGGDDADTHARFGLAGPHEMPGLLDRLIAAAQAVGG